MPSPSWDKREARTAAPRFFALLSPWRDDYDDVFIDCLPSRSLLAQSALTAADAILVPPQADYLAVQGLELTFQTALQTQR
jgi:cellulose biosynthesis protein BcsQ